MSMLKTVMDGKSDTFALSLQTKHVLLLLDLSYITNKPPTNNLLHHSFQFFRTPLHCAASCNNLKMVEFLVEHGACVFATTFSDHETAAEKCEEEEVGYDGCSQYLFSIQDKMGVINGGLVYAVYDYEAQNPDELSFQDGDRVNILRKGDEQEIDWWWAKEDTKNKEGYVPRNLFGLFPRVRPRKTMNGNHDMKNDNKNDSRNDSLVNAAQE